MKTHPAMGVAGLPDLLCCYRGRFLALEIKQPGRRNNTSALQKHWLDKFARAGAVTAVCTSVVEARGHLDTIDQELASATPEEAFL